MTQICSAAKSWQNFNLVQRWPLTSEFLDLLSTGTGTKEKKTATICVFYYPLHKVVQFLVDFCASFAKLVVCHNFFCKDTLLLNLKMKVMCQQKIMIMNEWKAALTSIHSTGHVASSWTILSVFGYCASFSGIENCLI